MSTADKKALQTELAAAGYAVSITDWPAKVTYYKADGEAMPNLPADPFSMRRYMLRGFSPVPPREPVEAKVVTATATGGTAVAIADGVFICEQCGFQAKSKFALSGHRHKHQKENKQ